MSSLREFAHIRIPFEEIATATNNFSKANLIGNHRFGSYYKGELLRFGQLIDIEVRRLSRSSFRLKVEFQREISMLSRLKHENIISMVGFCETTDEKIIVYKLEAHGRLHKYLRAQTLTWMQRLQICVGAAHALSYIHYEVGRNYGVIHRDIRSSKILLDDNWKAKISGFGLSIVNTTARKHRLLHSSPACGTVGYMDPVYVRTGGVTDKSDVYSFGIVLFEVLSGRKAFVPGENNIFLGPLAKLCYEEGKLDEMIDPDLRKQMDPQSLSIFSDTAYDCLKDQRRKRPDMDQIVRRLENALKIQRKLENPEHPTVAVEDTSRKRREVNRVDTFKIKHEDILLATDDFSEINLIGKGRSGHVYRGELSQAGGCTTIAVKRHVAGRGQGEQQFLNELEILFEYKHKNVIGLVGYCNERGEKIIVHEYASHGSLDEHLSNASLTWMKRLKICIDVASGLDFLHGGVLAQERVIHRDIKSANILLNHRWEAKISNFGLSMITQINQQFDFVVDDLLGTFGYVDPLYRKTGVLTLTKESDIYSFGVVLLEILSGRYAYMQNSRFLSVFAKRRLEEGKIDEIIFEGIKKQIVPESLTTFARIAYQCIHNDREARPAIREVLQQLRKALEFQEDVEVWEPALPRDYQQIITMSKSQRIYSTQSKKDLHDILSKGILLQNGEVERWVSSKGGVTNETISATSFSYKNLRSFKWRSIRKSRFSKVAKMLDISNLNIQIKIKTQFLSPGKIYGVYLVIKFWDKQKVSNEPIYLNLRYQKASKTLNAYFAEWKDEEWMMIELDRFLNHENCIEFDVLVERLSRNYCGSCAIFVEGIEFRAIDKVEHEENENPEVVEKFLRSDLNPDQSHHLLSNHEEIIKRSENYEHSASKEELYDLLSKGISIDAGQKVFFISKVNGKKCHMLPAKAVLYDSSHANRFNWRSLAESRFAEVGELLPNQVLCIKCNIETQMLSPSTAYACYVVYKISEKSRGLEFPVKVRDQLSSSNKGIKIVYFKSPSPVTFHKNKVVPEQRDDGRMEVMVWEFIFGKECKDDNLPMDLKLVSFEGKMSGLIVCGIEFRPI